MKVHELIEQLKKVPLHAEVKTVNTTGNYLEDVDGVEEDPRGYVVLRP